MKDDSYKTIREASRGLYKSKGSKFYAFGYPVTTEEEIRLHLQKLKKEHHAARHHCFAYRLGHEDPSYRINDDGEPSGTAGKPIFGRIISYDLTNVLIVVVRYFGGKLLGTSGLLEAYRTAAEDCIKNAVVVKRTIDAAFEIEFGYGQMNEVMRIINEGEVKIGRQVFEDHCKMELSIRKGGYEKITGEFMKIKDLTITMR
ncbi:MAG: YigZ family protein [Bacteroidales bacterium]|jgi:uncharacterized YigZ family protein